MRSYTHSHSQEKGQQVFLVWGQTLASPFKRCIRADEHLCLNYTRTDADNRSLVMDLCPLSQLSQACLGTEVCGHMHTHTHTHNPLGRVTVREASTVLLSLSHLQLLNDRGRGQAFSSDGAELFPPPPPSPEQAQLGTWHPEMMKRS